METVDERVEYLEYLVDVLRYLADKATKEEQKLRKENAALRENSMLIAQRALMVPSPFLPPEDKAELDRLRKAVAKWQSKAERRKKHIELLNGTLKNERERRKEAQKMARTLRARFEKAERTAERRKKHIELLNGRIHNEWMQWTRAQKEAQTFRSRLDEVMDIVRDHPLAPGTLIGTRQKWLKREILKKLHNLRWRPW